jgi:hypothetical protein
MNEVLPAALIAMQDKQAKVRAYGIASLVTAAMGSEDNAAKLKDAVPALLKNLNDPDWEVRAYAAEAFSSILPSPPPEIAPPLITTHLHRSTLMTADIESLVLEHLRAIRADIAELKREATATNVQLAAMGQQLGALTTAVYGGKSEIDELKRRVERMERRLELGDSH